MKVLQINAVYGYKSTGTIVKDIDELVRENGDESFVAYQTCREKPLNGYRIGNKLDWKLHALFSRVFGKQAFYSKRATKKLLGWMDGIRPDVVHLHNLHSNYINLPLLLKYLAKNDIATVVTLHDCWYFTGKCFHFAEDNCDKWRLGCENCVRNKKDVPSWLFDRSKKVFNDKKIGFGNIKNLTVVGCSDWISGLARQACVFKDKRVITIRNGVDTNIFARTERLFRKKHGLTDKFVVLGMANKWRLPNNVAAKDYIFNNLRDCVFVIVGSKKNDVGFAYDNVIRLEYVNNREELADVYSSADVFVNLTHADTLPTVNIESICCGTPVIAYDCCGNTELISESKTGFLIKEGDYVSIVDTIKKMQNKTCDATGITDVSVYDYRNALKSYIGLYKGMEITDK